MGKIHVMSDNLANKISAGEVVERIASVVKELVENAIDAQASEIKISLVNGGFNKIEVQDNGGGMSHEDALLAFERHATSKLIREDDLFFIDTLGFRGEALPSIASVSEVDLKTSEGDIGTHINIKGGKLITDEDYQAKKGTTISVNNLFYNTPARLKYLKSEQTEISHCVSFIEKLALSYPSIRFSLDNNSNVLVKTSGSNDLKKTIHEIYGLQISSKLIEVKASNDDYDVYGYICKPEVLKSNRNYMITIVNGRVVKNNDLNKAINDAYFRYKPDIKFPVVVLKFYTDPTLIDVNIHPTKQDIKLSKTNELYELIVKTIGDKLHDELLVPNALKEESFEVKEEKDEELPKEEEGNQIELDLSIPDTKPVVKEETPSFKSIANRVLNPEFKLLNLYVVGQVLGTYIVCQNDDGMYLIDQHAAKERVNYEKVEDSFKSKEKEVMDVLIPITIELSGSDFLLIREHIDVLEDMGFKIEEFGINTYKVISHPTWLKEGYEEEVIRNIFDEIIMLGDNFDRIRFNNRVIATIACKMSVRANTRLSREAMEEIVNELVKCRNPYNCAHGRPSIVKFSTYDLERMFKRVMN